MKLTTRRIAFAGILAAAYAALTIVEGMLFPNLAYGDPQFRFAEAFSVLCCFTPAAIPGMVIGCFVSNFFNPLGFSLFDAVFGTLATLLACVVTWLMTGSLRRQTALPAHPDKDRAAAKKLSWNRLLLILIVPLPTILFTTAIVGAELAVFLREGMTFWAAYGVFALSVLIGETVVLYALGVPLLIWLRRDPRQFRTLRSF